MTDAPLIGITLDYSESDTYSAFPWYALRADYSESIRVSGGVPIMLPYDIDAIDKYLDTIDGLVLPGGDFDIHPKYYGEKITNSNVSTRDNRTEFEIAICKKALEKKMPILGICAGHQLINVVHGGNIIQHIPDEVESNIAHEQPRPKNVPTHEIVVEEGTKLYSITGKTKYMVNTTHHQAVREPGDDIIVSAKAPDGVIEAIEHAELPFCIGVEWHPEYLACEEDELLMKAFIKACVNGKS